MREFPVLLEHLAAGELHLTGVLLLGPHLTEENQREVLRLAKHRSERELTKLLRCLDPLPAVPARIEPLGPAPRKPVPAKATWAAFMDALNPVRELVAEHCPSDWLRLGADVVPLIARRHPASKRSGVSPVASPADRASATSQEVAP